MKKLFTLLTLLVALVTSAWGTKTLIAKVTVTSQTEFTTDGTLIGSGATSGLGKGADLGKISGNTSYVAITLSDGNYFRAGDEVEISTTTTKAFQIFEGALGSNNAALSPLVTTGSVSEGVTTCVIPGAITANTSSISIGRTSSSYNGCVTYFAVYRNLNDEAYTVTFNQGSYGTSGSTNLTEASANAGITLPTVTANSGYDFQGWYDASSGGSKIGNPGEKYYPTANITLYAQYIQQKAATNDAYYVAASETAIDKQRIVGDNIAMTFVDGAEGNGFGTAVADANINGINANYVASLPGASNGWAVKFVPDADGVLSVGVIVNKSKTLTITNVSSFQYITSSATETISGNTWKPSDAKKYCVVVFPVTAGTEYSLSVDSKIGFYGFEFNPMTSITPAYEKVTYVTKMPLDFSSVSGLTAYVATAAAGGSVTLAEVGAVPAGTPLMLIGTAGTEYTVPVAASASAPAVNMFLAGDGTTEFDGSTFDYILFSDGLFYQIGSGAVPVGKAYLHCTSDPTAGSGAPSLSIDFGGTTGIDEVRGKMEDVRGEYYNLAGQRVAQPTKGLYIVNGKKVILK